jgi:hypothetical protein
LQASPVKKLARLAETKPRQVGENRIGRRHFNRCGHGKPECNPHPAYAHGNPFTNDPIAHCGKPFAMPPF